MHNYSVLSSLLVQDLQSYDGLEYFPSAKFPPNHEIKDTLFQQPNPVYMLKEDNMDGTRLYVLDPPPFPFAFPKCTTWHKRKTREGLTLDTTYSFVAEPTSNNNPLALEHLCSTHLHASIYLVIIKYYPTSIQDLSFISFFFLSKKFCFEKWQFFKILYCEKAHVTSKIWFSKFYPIY
jgi:hypothetical protein